MQGQRNHARYSSTRAPIGIGNQCHVAPWCVTARFDDATAQRFSGTNGRIRISDCETESGCGINVLIVGQRKDFDDAVTKGRGMM